MPTYAENLIGSVTVGAGGQSTITFSSIPQTYTDLVLRISARGSNTNYWAALALNGSSSNFTLKNVQGNGSAAYSNSDTTNTYSFHQNPSSYTANTFASTEFYIPNYTSANYKSISNETVQENNGTEAYSECTAMLWSNTAAISSITLTSGGGGNFVQYTTAYLYGIYNSQYGVTTKATGGDSIITSGGYTYHVFRATGTFTPTQSITADYLVIAGGGSGGRDAGGGGGAGGVRYVTSSSLSATPYTVTVGAGGAAPTSAGQGNSGSNSSFNSTVSTGGGGGGTFDATAGSSGGSGGGGGSGMSTGGAGGAASPSGQGNAGGTANSSYAGGGGGAGGAGVNGASGSTGGAGTNTYSTWASATYTGIGGYYAGGGGGGRAGGGVAAGGAGGGGVGSLGGSSAGSSGLASTGSGGGGDWQQSFANGSGGSGIVIVRYAV